MRATRLSVANYNTTLSCPRRSSSSLKLVARQGTSRPTPGPSLRAYEQARLRAEEAERGCPVCHRPLDIGGGQAPAVVDPVRRANLTTFE
jgi:hypothetical protein